MKILVVGWFSFEQMGASAGDLQARDLVCRWLGEEGLSYDIAVAAPFSGGIAWSDADPKDYSGLIFVCGPFGNGPPLTEFLLRFAEIPLIGVNLTMLQDLEEWNPFDLLFERDSSKMVRPDLVFLAEQPTLPVAGLILVHHQKEYGDRGMHQVADESVQRLIDSNEMSVVTIDTRLDENQVGLRSAGEVEALIARMDVVITTRLHGMVMALKNEVPPLVVDPIAGGAKILRQAKAIGWPIVFTADTLNDEKLQAALDFCLSPEAKMRTHETRDFAKKRLRDIQGQFLQGLRNLMRMEK